MKEHAVGKWPSKSSNSESWTGIQRWSVSSGSAGQSGHTERTCVIPRADLWEEDNATCKLQRIRAVQDKESVAVNIPSNVEPTVDDRVDVVYRGNGHVFQGGREGYAGEEKGE